MNKANDTPVLNVSNWFLVIDRWFIPGWTDHPIVVIILVVIAGNLLLHRTDRESLNVRVQQSTTVSIVLYGHSRSISDLKRTLRKVIASEMGLKEGTHLGVTRSGSV